MKKFIIRLILFAVLSYLIGEIIVRAFKLVPDIPQRFVDNTGIQRYKKGQSGYYTKAKTKWFVNDYGWLGVADTKKDTIISIIGDSYIENIMNPISCNQGNILKSNFKGYGFFEAGRSGITFIEAMEITNLLDSTIKPKIHLVYVSENDFDECIADKKRYTDRMQIDLKNKSILKAELKSSRLKKVLYSSKLLYYLYLRFPIFVSNQNKGETTQINKEEDQFNVSDYTRIFEFCSIHYELNRIVLVFHPGTKKEIISLAEQYGFQTILLNSGGDSSWDLGSHDGHWSCYGHNQVAKQIKVYLYKIITQ